MFHQADNLARSCSIDQQEVNAAAAWNLEKKLTVFGPPGKPANNSRYRKDLRCLGPNP